MGDGRVYVLEFTSGGKEMFYWMQEPKTDKDDEYCNKINELIKNPPQSAMYQQQQNFMNMFQGRQGSSQSNSSTPIELDQLQRILQQLPSQSWNQQQQSQQSQNQQGVEPFLNALQNQTNNESNKDSNNSEEKKDDDKMQDE